MPVPNNQSDVLQAFLELPAEEMEQLQKQKGVMRHLASLIPLALSYQDDLEDARKFFIQVKELTLPPKLDKQLDLLDGIRLGVVEAVSNHSLEPFELAELLSLSLEGIKKAYTRYAKLESDTINTIRTNSKGSPKEAFIEKVRSYWNYIDDMWPSHREQILQSWTNYLEDTESLLKNSGKVFQQTTGASPHGVLIQVADLLKKRSAHFISQRAADGADRIKNYHVEELGLIPAYMGSQGNWKVEKDDCPDKQLPETHTKLTDRFAFCRLSNKECPSFDWSQGSYVKCKSFVRLKEASLLGEVKTLTNKRYVAQLRAIAETDPFVKMLFIESKRRTGELYVGKVIDEGLEEMLGQYPTSNRVGEFKYRVYMVANEPVLVSGEYAISADKILLETIGEGERMPKQAATLRIAGPVMRVTFTANALRDPEFRDFLRKKNAIKTKHSTYDVPFEREEDIGFFLAEVKDEFNYKVEVFQIMEDVDEWVGRDFGLYRFSDLPLSRFSSFRVALSYLPVVQNVPARVGGNVRSMKGAEKLVDVANNMSPDNPMRSRIATLADRLRVGAHILIAASEDVIRHENGAIGLLPEPGSRWMQQDPDTKDTTLVECESSSNKNGKAELRVRRLDTGKEIVLNACGGPMGMSAPPSGMPFGHIIGEDDIYYIVQVPKAPGLQGPTLPQPFDPPAFGRFPGDTPAAPPPSYPGLNPSVMEHGPIVEQEEVYVVDGPEVSSGGDIEAEGAKQKAKGLKFLSIPPPSKDSEVDGAVEKLRSMFKSDPRVKKVRSDISAKGKPVIYLHSTMPKATKDEAPDSVEGFEVVVAPFNGEDDLEEPEDSTADSLVNPMPNRPENGRSKGREYPPGPYMDQVSGPPAMGDQLVTQIRDIPKGR